MQRGTFNKLLAFSGFAGLGNIDPDQSSYRSIKRIKPKKLKPGDTIGLITPASPISEEAFSRTLKNLESLGFNYKTGDNIFKKYGYLAGEDMGRVDDIHKMFSDPEIDAVWCIRGGYGTTRILNNIDYSLIKNNPKVFIGYSDITALHIAIYRKTGLITFHGPVASSEFTEYTIRCFRNLFFENFTAIGNFENADNDSGDTLRHNIIVPGRMEGRLMGGNLSLLTALAGTEFQMPSENHIIFIEDIDEKPYRIDRMLTQLIDSSFLQKASGILLGIFKGCEAKPDEKNTLQLNETLVDRLSMLGIPVFYGFSFGHIDNHCTIPVGIKAGFDTENQILFFKEKALAES
ncbi:MAG: S66 peptidase family protein [Deltaproteobacteria bacterium]